MHLLHPRFRVVHRHQIHVVLMALIAVAVLATMNTPRVDGNLAKAEQQISDIDLKSATISAARKLASAQAHMLAARTSEIAILQSLGGAEDRAAWERSIASASRALRSLERSPDGGRFAFHVQRALGHLREYGHHVETTIAGLDAGSTTVAPGVKRNEAHDRFEAAYQATADLSSLLADPAPAPASSVTLAFGQPPQVSSWVQ